MADFPNSTPLPEILHRGALSRRSIMRGMAAAVVGASVPAAAAIVPADHPEIVRLRSELGAAFVGYRRAIKARADVLTEWMPRWPAPPKKILRGYGRDMERSLAGWAIKDAADNRVYVHTAKDLRAVLSKAKGKGHQKSLRQQIAIAEAFEQEKDRIKALSGYEAANANYWSAAERLQLIVQAIMERPGEGLQDDLLRARALVVFGRMEYIISSNRSSTISGARE